MTDATTALRRSRVLRHNIAVRIAYLFSRYPVVSQTFCDTEILALEKLGVELEIHSIYAPPTSFRHGHSARIKAEVHYAPPQSVLKLHEERAKAERRWPVELIEAHDRKYGKDYKASLRARNALYFADLFRARGITHFHVHFANRAAHTAVFLKAISGLPFSMSTHGQDFMTDLGNHDLLREICREAVFVANETEWSKALVASLAPDSGEKMRRVFNGMDLGNFREPAPLPDNPVPRIITTGRLIEFKGFHHLIPACAELKKRGLTFLCEIIGEGPWRGHLEAQIAQHGLAAEVALTGSLPQEEVFRRLRASDIFTLPCIVDKDGASDVFPTVILEAMASAKPVVSTRIAGVPEQIVPEETGLICEPGDEAGLADALARLLESPELRQRMGLAGRARLESEFVVSETIKPLLAEYEKCVPPASPAPRPQSAVACLLDEWPCGERHDAELRQLHQAIPGTRCWSVRAGEAEAPRDAHLSLAALEFFPDAIVIEADWIQRRDDARLVETFRVGLGTKLSSEDFLAAARVAVHLARVVRRDGLRHFHALGSMELLAVWLLRKICGISISATLDEKNPRLHRAVLTLLARDCTAARISDDKLREEIGREFSATGRVITPARSGRSLEPEFVKALAALR